MALKGGIDGIALVPGPIIQGISKGHPLDPLAPDIELIGAIVTVTIHDIIARVIVCPRKIIRLEHGDDQAVDIPVRVIEL